MLLRACFEEDAVPFACFLLGSQFGSDTQVGTFLLVVALLGEQAMRP
jgi:hypothetical protein